MELNVNVSEVIKFTDKLDRIGKNALPTAVRNTLNTAAFDTKKQVPITASANFITRNRSFFRSFTLVNKAGGNDINKMQSEVGINASRAPKVAEGLEKQETGGTIGNRSLIAMNQARTSGSLEKRIKKTNYLSNVRISKSKKKGTGTGFIMIKHGSKGTVFATSKKKLTPIYSYQAGRSVKVKKTPFMEQSAMKIQQRIPAIYTKEAQRTIKRYLK